MKILQSLRKKHFRIFRQARNNCLMNVPHPYPHKIMVTQKWNFAVVLFGDKRKYVPSSRSFDSTIICPTTGCPSSCWSSYTVGGEFLLKESLGHFEKMRLTLKQLEACEFNYLYLIPVCYGCQQIHPTQSASGGRSRFSGNFNIYIKIIYLYLNKCFPVGGNTTSTVSQRCKVVFAYPWEEVTTTNILKVTRDNKIRHKVQHNLYIHINN